MEKKLTSASYLIVSLSILLLPIWTIPGIAGSVAIHKTFLLVVVAGLLGLIWSARTVISKRVWLSFSPFNLALLGLAAAALFSALLSQNPLYQLSGRFLSLAAAAFFLLFTTTLVPRLRWATILRLLLWSGTLLSIFTWLQLTPLSPVTWMNQLLGTHLPTGLQYSLADNHLILLLFLFPVGLSGLVAAWETRHAKIQAGTNRWIALLQTPLPWSLVVLGTAFLVLGLTLRRPELNIAFLPYSQGWRVWVENLKSWRWMLFGFGPENFSVAFHRFRDVSYNALPIWNVRFTSSSSELLQTATTIGLLGLAAWLALVTAVLRTGARVWRAQPSLAIFLTIQLVIFFLLPFNHLLFFALALGLLALTNQLQENHQSVTREVIFLFSAIRITQPGSLKTVKTQAGFSLVAALIVSLVVFSSWFAAGRVYAGSIFFELARQAADQNDLRQTYQHQRWSVIFQPRNPLYRRSYAFTNLTMAKLLARNENPTEEQRVLISRVLQQAIREGRLAALLNPAETENWEALANIYANILDVEGSRDWAIAAMVQAIQTDPLHPSLRLNLGNLYLVIGQNDQALRLIEQAIQLKPDFGQSYISYGTVLEQRNEPALAAQAYQRALDLLGEVDGADQLRTKIAALQKEAQEEVKAQPESTPQGIPDAGAPSVPAEQPTQQNPPDEFGSIVQGKDPKAEQSTSTPEPTPVVLPSNIGF